MSYSDIIELETQGFTDVIDISGKVAAIVDSSGIRDGLVTIFCTGSTATVTTIEYEAGVIQDLKDAFEKIAPVHIPYEHNKRWGDGNGFSHVRAGLTKPSLAVPLIRGKMSLGTWQQIVLIDFDNRPRERSIVVQILGS
jgi:secondary thiamine-phosphate synthase enzyme